MTWVKPLMVGIISLLITVNPVFSQEPEEKEDPKATSPKDEETPSLEFLEFLGEFESEEGTWTGPEELEELMLDDPEEKNDENDKN